MPKYQKETKTIYQGKEMWVQVDPQALQETGEIRTVGEPVLADASITKCDRNGFEITYLLAKKCEVTVDTVSRTLKLLKEKKD